MLGEPDYPQILDSPHLEIGVNERIVLYSGECRYFDGVVTTDGTCDIALEWLPSPELRFRGTFEDPALCGAFAALQEGQEHWSAEVTLGAGWDGASLKLKIAGISIGSENKLRGHFESFAIGNTDSLAALGFHLANGPNYRGTPTKRGRGVAVTRSEFGTAEWVITLDALLPYRPKAHRDELKEIGGYTLTHVGRLTRRDGAEFPLTDATTILSGLTWFLAFAAGGWGSPRLIIGHDSKGSVISRVHREFKVSPMPRRHSWLSELTPCEFADLFPGFFAAWTNPLLTNSIELGTYWYVSGIRCEGGVEGALVQVHSALDSIAWSYCVELLRLISGNGFEKLPASDRLRLLLRQCGVPLEIPSHFKALTSFAAAYRDSISDGADAISVIRNCYVHPTPKNERKQKAIPEGFKHEAWILGLHYLELAMLRMCQFKGKYSNRVADVKWRGAEVEVVPWAK